MGYLHIENLYKNQTILLFRECYALEKIHGTSAHLSWKKQGNQLHFSPGGESINRFKSLFNSVALVNAFEALGHDDVVVYGEAYGGSQQKQSWRYGKDLKFIVFDIKIGDTWLTVPNAADVASKLGLEFVDYSKVSTDLESLNAERDAPSTQAQRNGVEGFQPREGVILRPLMEFMLDGERVISKHKRDEERETNQPRKVVDPAQMEVLSQAADIALEWVTETRLEHVLDKLPQGIGIEKTGDVIRAMVEDVLREGKGEIVDSKEARQAIGKRAGELFRNKLKKI